MKVLAATYNPVSNTKMFSIMLDIPTVLLAELRTHRILTQGSLYEHMELDDFNMSANSARAIPTKNYLQKVLDNPFVPIWTKRQSGMSGELIEQESVIEMFNNIWLGILDRKNGLDLGNYNVGEAYYDLVQGGVHKQNANRLLAPWAYTTCILSGTEWSNFFSLRCPHYITEGKLFYSKKQCLKELEISGSSTGTEFDPNFDWNSINKSSAQPEFQVIAEQIYDLYCEADWKESKYHIPFKEDIDRLYHKEISKQDTFEEGMNLAMKVSASMCAKLSYDTQENVDTLEKHIERADKLKESQHWEVFSHQAVAMTEYDMEYKFYNVRSKKKFELKSGDEILYITEDEDGTATIKEKGWCYNLRGFISQRYTLENL